MQTFYTGMPVPLGSYSSFPEELQVRKFFISYVYEDRQYKDQLIDWHRLNLITDWMPVYEQADVRAGGWRAVKSYLSPLISQCNSIIVLIGNDTHNHQAISYEVQNARSAGLKVISVRIPNTTGAAPPTVPSPTVRFTVQDVLRALNEPNN